jgi:hypothetical protein
MSAISYPVSTSHVKGLIDYFDKKPLMGTLDAHAVEPIASDYELIEADSGFLTAQQKKVIGVAMMVLALGLSVIPFTMPLGLALAIGITVASSAISFSGSILYARGASSRAVINMKEAAKTVQNLSKSDTVRKALAVALMTLSVSLSLIPVLKAIEIIGSILISGTSLLIGEIGARIYKKEVQKDETERVYAKLMDRIASATRFRIFHRGDNNV